MNNQYGSFKDEIKQFNREGLLVTKRHLEAIRNLAVEKNEKNVKEDIDQHLEIVNFKLTNPA